MIAASLTYQLFWIILSITCSISSWAEIICKLSPSSYVDSVPPSYFWHNLSLNSSVKSPNSEFIATLAAGHPLLVFFLFCSYLKHSNKYCLEFSGHNWAFQKFSLSCTYPAPHVGYSFLEAFAVDMMNFCSLYLLEDTGMEKFASSRMAVAVLWLLHCCHVLKQYFPPKAILKCVDFYSQNTPSQSTLHKIAKIGKRRFIG